ncbi:MAG: SDR family oxidoreductase [Proteobacteria bacterium]|nr:SDR family oxidoreductase [Pseudomonadota bacterium]
MKTLHGQVALVTGGSRGLGLAVVEALHARGAKVAVLARDTTALRELESRFAITALPGDATDPRVADDALRRVRPSVLVLNAGATPLVAPLDQQTWESFSAPWNTDVKASFHWVQAALRLPLAAGSRVLLSSSGAAVSGSPLSGGYAGAKRTIWLMAGYANAVAKAQGLDVRFQAVVPRQIVGATALGRAAAEGYARHHGKTTQEFLAGFGAPLEPRAYAEHVVTLLTDSEHEGATALGIHSGTGIEVLQ